MGTKVVWGLATPPGMAAGNNYFTLASTLGYDREEGFDLEIKYTEEPGATARALCEGACDYASLNTTVGLLGRDEGLPMTAVYGMARRTHRWFSVLPESPIRTLADLKGKNISCDFPYLQSLAEAALSEEGVPRGSYRWVPWHGSGMQAGAMVEPLRRGEVDAVFIIDWNDGDFIASGLPLRRLPSSALDRTKVSSCLWVEESTVATKPEMIVGIARALTKAVVFCFENPEAAVRLMWKRHPETRPTTQDEARTLHRDLEIIKARFEPFRIDPNDKDPRWGAIDEDDIVRWQDFLIAAGQIKKRIDPRLIFTDRFVDDFNRFDEQAIRKQARETKVDG